MKGNAANVLLKIKEEIANPFIRTEVYFQSPESGLYTVELMNRTIDICTFFTNKLYEPTFQIALRIVQDYGDFPRSCPIKVVCHLATIFHRLKILNKSILENLSLRKCDIRCRTLSNDVTEQKRLF